MAVERHQEINNLEEVIKSTNDQIEIKRQRLQRAKNLNDFALCDILSSAITALLVKKADHERQLTALNKKDAKSKKYLLKKVSNNPSQGRMSQKKKNTSILDMMCMKKTGVEIGKQSTDLQVIVVEEEQSVIEHSESFSSRDTLILEKSDEVPKQSADYQEDQSVLERSESSSSGNTLILEKSDEVPKEFDDIVDLSDEDVFGNILPVKDASVTNL